MYPLDNRLINFSVAGAGTNLAAANGDPTCLDLFHLPKMHAFHGQFTPIVQSETSKSRINFSAFNDELKSAHLTIKVE